MESNCNELELKSNTLYSQYLQYSSILVVSPTFRFIFIKVYIFYTIHSSTPHLVITNVLPHLRHISTMYFRSVGEFVLLTSFHMTFNSHQLLCLV
jgi:hypothetical protein